MPTPIELARIAAAINLLRPDWPTKSLQTLLERDHATRPFHDLAVAAAWIATDPQSQTPARLSEAGPWWTALRTSSTPIPERFNLDQWRAEMADAVPPPPDFQARVEAARAETPVPAPPTEQPKPPVDSPARAAARAEIEALRRRQAAARRPVDPPAPPAPINTTADPDAGPPARAAGERSPVNNDPADLLVGRVDRDQ